MTPANQNVSPLWNIPLTGTEMTDLSDVSHFLDPRNLPQRGKINASSHGTGDPPRKGVNRRIFALLHPSEFLCVSHPPTKPCRVFCFHDTAPPRVLGHHLDPPFLVLNPSSHFGFFLTHPGLSRGCFHARHDPVRPPKINGRPGRGQPGKRRPQAEVPRDGKPDQHAQGRKNQHFVRVRTTSSTGKKVDLIFN